MSSPKSSPPCPFPTIQRAGFLALAVSALAGAWPASLSAAGRRPPSPTSPKPVPVEQAAQEPSDASPPQASTPTASSSEEPSAAAPSPKRRGKWPPSADPKGLPPGAKIERVWIWQESSDCLWKIAKEYYGNPYLWPKIYEANRQLIKDPNLIYPKQAIIIPPLDAAAPPARSAEELPGVPARSPGAADGGSAPAKER